MHGLYLHSSESPLTKPIFFGINPVDDVHKKYEFLSRITNLLTLLIFTYPFGTIMSNTVDKMIDDKYKKLLITEHFSNLTIAYGVEGLFD